MAMATGMAPSTIGRGLRELAQDEPSERVRRPGAGRKPTIVKDPTLVPHLEALVEPTTRGDPEAPLRWTCKSVRQFLQTPPDRARRHAGCHRHRGNATITRSKCLRRCDQTTAPFVKKRRYRGKPLPDGFDIDHHHNIWYDQQVVNPYSTLSKVDSTISGQVLTSLEQSPIRSSSS